MAFSLSALLFSLFSTLIDVWNVFLIGWWQLYTEWSCKVGLTKPWKNENKPSTDVSNIAIKLSKKIVLGLNLSGIKNVVRRMTLADIMTPSRTKITKMISMLMGVG